MHYDPHHSPLDNDPPPEIKQGRGFAHNSHAALPKIPMILMFLVFCAFAVTLFWLMREDIPPEWTQPMADFYANIRGQAEEGLTKITGAAKPENPTLPAVSVDEILPPPDVE